MVLCIPETNLPMMLARLALGLCVDPGLPCTGVSVINITAVGVTFIPILPMLVGSGRTKGLLLAATRITKTHGWLLWGTTAAILTATIAFVVVVERALLLSRGIDASW